MSEATFDAAMEDIAAHMNSIRNKLSKEEFVEQEEKNRHILEAFLTETIVLNDDDILMKEDLTPYFEGEEPLPDEPTVEEYSVKSIKEALKWVLAAYRHVSDSNDELCEKLEAIKKMTAVDPILKRGHPLL